MIASPVFYQLEMQILTLVIAVCSVIKNDATPRGASWMISGFHPSQCSPGLLIADQSSLCWFWSCLFHPYKQQWYFKPQRCALGTQISPSYFADQTNPCTVKLGENQSWDCTRMVHIEVEMTDADCGGLVCKNGGTLKEREDRCWCECPAEWQGEADCSKKVGQPSLYNDDGACSDPVDYCEQGAECLNGGTCHPTCGGHYCDCIPPFTNGPNCETFSCEHDNHCKNGGKCDRGAEDMDEYQVCICPRGFRGDDCSIH